MRHVPSPLVLAAVLGLALLPLVPAFGAGGPLRQFVQRDSYRIGEGGASRAAKPAPDASVDPADAGPIRLARFSYVQGNVTWRASEGAAWSAATVNLPIRQGAQVWVTNGGRAEVQFDDGSLLRLGTGAVATLQTLFSDADGEFTEIQMSEGLSMLELRASNSIYQVDTPLVSIKSEGPSKVRIGVGSDVEIAVHRGRAAVEGSAHKTILEAGRYLDLTDAAAAFQAGRLPDPDTWDRWNDSRDRRLAGGGSGDRLPPDIALVAGDLNDYGSWHDDARYGAVWCPSVSESGWRPYQHGQWTWVEPFGWTWVSSEAWGWAPYHYGTWISEPYGWAWVPGPARQPWCPAVVHFSEYDGAVAWAPLCPSEVRYPPALRPGGRDWSLSFSIGQAAVYYPDSDFYCTARPFSNVVVNQVTYVTNVTNIYPGSHPDIRPTGPRRLFIPFNARNAAGVTTASRDAFGGRGDYQPQPRASTAFFVRGRATGAPSPGIAPVAGPTGVRPTAMAFTPSRTFLPDAPSAGPALRRPLYRAPLPPPVAQAAPSSPRPPAFGLRPGAIRMDKGTGEPDAAPERPVGSRPESPENGDTSRSRRLPLPLPSASEPTAPADRARQARRILGQPTPEESAPSSSRRERPAPDASAAGEGSSRPPRPGRVFPGDANPPEAPRAPRRPEPAEPVSRPAREPEPPAAAPPAPPPAPVPAPAPPPPPEPAPPPPPAPSLRTRTRVPRPRMILRWDDRAADAETRAC